MDTGTKQIETVEDEAQIFESSATEAELDHAFAQLQDDPIRELEIPRHSFSNGYRSRLRKMTSSIL